MKRYILLFFTSIVLCSLPLFAQDDDEFFEDEEYDEAFDEESAPPPPPPDGMRPPGFPGQRPPPMPNNYGGAGRDESPRVQRSLEDPVEFRLVDPPKYWKPKKRKIRKIAY